MATENRKSPPEGLVCVGVVTGARGLKGEVRIKSFTADPADVAAYGEVSDESRIRSFPIRVCGQVKGLVIARLEGIADRTAAEALKGTMLFVPRDALPEPGEEEYYHADLIGLRAELAGGGELGTVKAVGDFGAGAILEIASADGKEVMVPFTRAIVPEVDLAAGRVVVDPPDGLLEAPAAQDDGMDES